MEIITWKMRFGDSSLKLTFSAAYTKNLKLTSKELVIDNLMRLKFKLSTDISDSTISCSYSISKYSYCKTYCTLKMNITSSDFPYSQRDIHIPEEWCPWQLMNTVPAVANGNDPVIYTKMWDFYITIHEVKTDTVSSQLYIDREFTDFYLTAADGSIAVHKALLAAHSDVFKAMLSREWKETVQGQINIEGVTVQTLELLKDMYLGSVPDKGLRPLLLMARCYMIEDLERHCVRKIAETVLPEELFSLVDFACENNIPKLAFAIVQLTTDSVIEKAQKVNFEIISWRKSKKLIPEEV